MSEADEAKDLAVSSARMLLAALGVVLGAGPAGVAAVGIKEIADQIRNRREAKRVRRLEAIVNSLSARMADHVSDHEVTDEDQDMFLSVLEAFLADDEELKQPLYEAVLEWMVRDDPPAMQVRWLGDAVRNLSYVELFCFVSECTGQGTRADLYDRHLDKSVLVHRLVAAGLTETTGVRTKGSPTIVGRVLLKYVSKSDLSVPPDPRRQ